MRRIGIITYHAAYNYGSVMQAYALLVAIQNLGKDVCIINYRPYSQKNYYCLYRTKCGTKNLIKDIFQIGNHSYRKLREQRFEDFIRDSYVLTREFNSLNDVLDAYNMFDLIVSGSDQIWNKNSWELRYVDWKCMNPYLLKGFNGKKVSYASSIGSMTDDDFKRIIPLIREFNYLSFREESTLNRFNNFECDVFAEVVLDPTFLLDGEQWIAKMGLAVTNDTPYVLYYSLSGYKTNRRRKSHIKEFARKAGCELWIINPTCNTFWGHKGIEIKKDFGPREFLNALYNAKFIVTDSYHGTILSVNLNKQFYSICESGGSEYRKTDILNRIGLSDRIISDVRMLNKKMNSKIDYDAINHYLENQRKKSVQYLKRALE